MKKSYLPGIVLCIIILSAIAATAQDTPRFRRDSLRGRFDANRRADTSRSARGQQMASLFADSTQLTSSDYQLQIEKAYVVLNNIENKSELGPAITDIKDMLTANDTMLAVLKTNLSFRNRALNVRNLQVFEALLEDMYSALQKKRRLLDSTEKQLNYLRNDLQALMADTILKHLQGDSVLRQQFSSQLRVMREAWRSGTRHLRRSLADINQLQTQTSSSSILSSQLLERINNLLARSAARIFSKETNYLWEKDTSVLQGKARYTFSKTVDAEKKALRYYFRDSGSKRLLLLLAGLLFFIWVYINIRTLKKTKTQDTIKELGFEYLPSGYIVSAFVVMLCIAPLFDLQAPSAYIESVEFLLVIILTVICWKKWPRNLFIYWVAMVILYVLFSFSHHLGDPEAWHRWGLMALNILSVVFGMLFLSGMKQHLQLKGFLRFVIILHNVMNILAIICNFWGRISLTQILGNAAIFAFMQAVGLAVFSKICMEALLLQIVASRMRRGVQTRFEYQHLLKSFGRPVLILVIVLWLIVFTSNLYVYNAILDIVTGFLSKPRYIGSASFTLGGVTLFFLIIWLAHLLQKYIGYFFGDTGKEEDLQNKKERSRLLIARLILLSLGYLLAVAASGIPVDKITIVVGALGVGIGLGLQNIVNNFVSGIVLIFDRPLQIGDIVEIGDKEGRVREIGLRSTTLLTNNGAEVIIPNGDILSQQIVNWTLTNNQQRLEMDLSLSGNNDMETVSSAVKKAVLSSSYIFENRDPQVLFTKVTEDGFDLKVFFWCSDVSKADAARSEVLLLLHEKLKDQNIVMH